MENIEQFKTWLEKRGAVIVPPTNEWEILRFRSVNGVSVVYTNKRGYLTFTGESEKAYKSFKGKKDWRATDKKRRSLKDRKARLASRDGKKCFCCTEAMGFDELTIEHLLSKIHGGTDNINNLVLACQPCNIMLGGQPLAKKIELIMQKRASRKWWKR